jgi:putative NADH-flavin reductase
MKKIVLIGASGFIGSAILNEALNRGIKVTADYYDLSSNPPSFKNYKF